MIVTGEDEAVNYDIHLHKCSRTKRSDDFYYKYKYIEHIYREHSLITFIITSCCCLVLGLFFVFVLKSSQ